MQRAPNRCPGCGRSLAISWDMWGPYYLCSDCGFTAEDDDELKLKPSAARKVAFPIAAMGPPQSHRSWQAVTGRRL